MYICRRCNMQTTFSRQHIGRFWIKKQNLLASGRILLSCFKNEPRHVVSNIVALLIQV